MKIDKLIDNKSQVLYDGFCAELNQEFNIIIGEENIAFKISDLINNSFKNIKDFLSKNDLEIILEKGEIKNNVPEYIKRFISENEYTDLIKNANYYKSESHLALNYFVKNDLLLLFTYGEKQPSRWILILENVWKIK
ncbi:hypothetical protein [Chryseobacterium indoltheticum]|uniref:hypothetical protein n=1 Tax=Chryseobacterium indoltheticum TaxID=254 RepID=UPI0028E3A452|nr:hypothetical protein [Chryseobacterium indoltheticum]